MNRRTLAIGVAGGLASPFLGFGHQAGAVDICDTNHAVATHTLTIHQDSAELTATARPGCEGADFSLAVHRTDFLAFDANEVQPLVASATGTLPGTISVVFPGLVGSQCNYQVDAVTGAPLPQVSPTSRYNTFPLGGDINRLVQAAYADNVCEETGPPASPPVTVPDAPPPPVLQQAPPTPVPPGLADIPPTAGQEPLLPPVVDTPVTVLDHHVIEDLPVVTAQTLPVTGGVHPGVVSALVAIMVALAWTVQLYGVAAAWAFLRSALQPVRS